MSCSTPCLSCTGTSFTSCLSCDTSINSNSVLLGSQCDSEPTWFIQLPCTCLFLLFAIMPLVRKRSLVLMRIFDAVQMVSFFKYINAFVYYRHNLLYLEMRSMNPWSQGWKLLTIGGDLVTPVFLNEETYINKLIRISSIWIAILILLLIVAVIRISCREGKLSFSTYIQKNIKNALCIAFYLTVQDLAFFCAANFYSHSFSTALGIVFFCLAILIAILSFVFLLWQSKAINHTYKSHQEDLLYNYELMFLYRFDYDLFQTYSLTNLPERQKKVFRYSNLGLFETIKKIGFAFLVVSFLYKSNVNLQSQTYSLLGFIIFFQLLWYISLPFDPKSEIAQLIICIFADLVLIAILVMPLAKNDSSGDMVHLILCLFLLVLAILSVIFEIGLDLYTFIPYDLYKLGLTVVIEDKQLRAELQKRKREQQQNERKIRQLKEEQERMKQELEKQRNKRSTTFKGGNEQKSKQRSRKPSKDRRQLESQVQINNGDSINNFQELATKGDRDQQLVYPIESEEGDELDNYKLDPKKKRVVYSFNKKVPFIYSNKVEQ